MVLGMKNDPCPKCGLNLNMVGMAHRCVPRSMAPSKAEAVTRAVVRKTTKAVERAAVGSSEPAAPVTSRGRGRPAGSAYAGRQAVLIRFDPAAVEWLDGEFVRRRLPSRVDLIRALVDEARVPK